VVWLLSIGGEGEEDVVVVVTGIRRQRVMALFYPFLVVG
jgi:hypothetical protein